MNNKNIAAHDRAVTGMFGGIASYYDFLNRLLSLGIDQYWRKVLAETVKIQTNGLVLDLAAGTLDVSLAIKRKYPSVTVLALDFCYPMLQRGQSKINKENTNFILPAVADAKHLPLPDASVDSLTIAFGIRNILPRQEAFAEMLRVLRPHGRVCILEFGSGRERILGGLYNFYLDTILPRVGRFFSKDQTAYTYLAQTIDAFPAADELAEEMRTVGFRHIQYRKLSAGIVCLHVGERD